MDEPVQEVIDRSDNLEECLEELKGSGAKTYLPASVRNGDICHVGKDHCCTQKPCECPYCFLFHSPHTSRH